MNFSKALSDLRAVTRLMAKDNERWEEHLSNQEAAQSASLNAREAPVSRQEGQGPPTHSPAPRPLTLVHGGRDDE